MKPKKPQFVEPLPWSPQGSLYLRFKHHPTKKKLISIWQPKGGVYLHQKGKYGRPCFEGTAFGLGIKGNQKDTTHFEAPQFGDRHIRQAALVNLQTC